MQVTELGMPCCPHPLHNLPIFSLWVAPLQKSWKVGGLSFQKGESSLLNPEVWVWSPLCWPLLGAILWSGFWHDSANSATAWCYLGGGKCPWLRPQPFWFSQSLLKWRFECRWHTELSWAAFSSNTANRPKRPLEDSPIFWWLLPSVRAV